MIFCFSPLMILCAAVRFNYPYCFDPSPAVKCCFPLHWLYFLLQLHWEMSCQGSCFRLSWEKVLNKTNKQKKKPRLWMFWVMTRLFPFQQLHLAPSELSPLAQGRFHSSIRSRCLTLLQYSECQTLPWLLEELRHPPTSPSACRS